MCANLLLWCMSGSLGAGVMSMCLTPCWCRCCAGAGAGGARSHHGAPAAHARSSSCRSQARWGAAAAAAGTSRQVPRPGMHCMQTRKPGEHGLSCPAPMVCESHHVQQPTRRIQGTTQILCQAADVQLASSLLQPVQGVSALAAAAAAAMAACCGPWAAPTSAAGRGCGRRWAACQGHACCHCWR
jgi:hypothetical protein